MTATAHHGYHGYRGYPAHHRHRLAAAPRALNLAMCRALHQDWDLEASAQRLVASGLDRRAIAIAHDVAAELDRHDPTEATTRAEQCLRRALALLDAADRTPTR